jgi:lysophospholipase L1-like esterase
MRASPRSAAILGGAFLWLAGAAAQQNAVLPDSELVRLSERVLQLMDSTKVAIPELARAGEPVTENARQAFAAMRATGPRNSALVHTFLTNLRAYLQLADAVPKPYPFPEEARLQFAELRDARDRLDSHFSALLQLKEAQLRDPDRDALRRYAEANLKIGAPQPGTPRVVFLGDSITDLWRLNEYFPPERDIVNRGIGGQITGQMLGRMKADVVDLKPALVLVLAGANDIARGISLKAIEDNLTMIAALAEANKIKPVFASLLPISDYHKDENPAYEMSKLRPPETIRAVNDWLRKFCGARNYVYVDYYSQLADASGFLKADSSDDGLHPNSKGYRLMAPAALAAIDKLLQPPPQKKRRILFFGGQ